MTAQEVFRILIKLGKCVWWCAYFRWGTTKLSCIIFNRKHRVKICIINCVIDLYHEMSNCWELRIHHWLHRTGRHTKIFCHFKCWCRKLLTEHVRISQIVIHRVWLSPQEIRLSRFQRSWLCIQYMPKMHIKTDGQKLIGFAFILH